MAENLNFTEARKRFSELAAKMRSEIGDNAGIKSRAATYNTRSSAPTRSAESKVVTASPDGSTLYWNGTPVGLELYGDMNEITLVKLSEFDDPDNMYVSEITVTTHTGESYTVSMSDIDIAELLVQNKFLDLSFGLITIEDNVVIEDLGIVLPKAGVYAITSPLHVIFGEYMDSITLTGYTGFVDKEDTGDTLYWDGNTEGLYSVLAEGGGLYKVSDVVPTLDDFANGHSMAICAAYQEEVMPGVSQVFMGVPMPAGGMIDVGGALVNLMSTVVICYTPNIDIDGIVLEQTGIYFMHAVDTSEGMTQYVGSLTIHGYTGFKEEEVIIGPVKRTITWDGNTEGAYTDELLIKISDFVPSFNYMSGGVTYTLDANGVSTDMYGHPNIDPYTGVISFIGDDSDIFSVIFSSFFVISENCTMEGLEDAPPGIYMYNIPDISEILAGQPLENFSAAIAFHDSYNKFARYFNFGGEDNFYPLPIVSSADNGKVLKVTDGAWALGDLVRAGGDTLYWDGNTEGLYRVDIGSESGYHVSNAIPTITDLNNEYTIIMSNGAVFTTNGIYDTGYGILVNDYIAIVTVPNANVMGITFEKAGVYFVIQEEDGSYPISLTIPGFGGF